MRFLDGVSKNPFDELNFIERDEAISLTNLRYIYEEPHQAVLNV
jgi:hypothetical protein